MPRIARARCSHRRCAPACWICRRPPRRLRPPRIRCRSHLRRAPAFAARCRSAPARIFMMRAHIARHTTDRAHLAVIIQHRHIAFRRAVEFHDARNGEAFLESRPDLRAQSVAGDRADAMHAVFSIGRRVQEIAAKLADILENGGAIEAAIFPEFMGREFALDDQREPPVVNAMPDRADAARRMIERQRAIDAVFGFRIQPARKAVHHEQHAHMGEVRRLGQARRARGVDVEGGVLAGEARACRLIRRHIRGRVQSGVEIARADRLPARDPGRRQGIDGGSGLQPAFGKLGADYGMARTGNRNRMDQRIALEIGVDQRHHRAEFEEAQPGHQIFGAVLHQEHDRIAAFDALAARPIGIAVRAIVEALIAERAILIKNGDSAGCARGLFFDDVDDGARRVRLQPADAQQGSRDAAYIDIFAPDAFEQSHRRIGLV